MTRPDLVIRNGTVATAADVISCDVGIAEGRIVALGESLEADQVIDAAVLKFLRFFWFSCSSSR